MQSTFPTRVLDHQRQENGVWSLKTQSSLEPGAWCCASSPTTISRSLILSRQDQEELTTKQAEYTAPDHTPGQIRSDQSDQHDRVSARLSEYHHPTTTLTGLLSDRTPATAPGLASPSIPTLRAPRGDTVTQAQTLACCCQTHPMPSPSPVFIPPQSLSLDPLFLFCFTYFYFWVHRYSKLVGQLTISCAWCSVSIPTVSSCLQTTEQVGGHRGSGIRLSRPGGLASAYRHTSSLAATSLARRGN